MKSYKLLMLCICLMSLLLAMGLFGPTPNAVQAGRRKMLKNAALAAVLLSRGKKVLVPLPIPVPIPFLRQSQPIYYEQPHYSSYPSHHSY